MSESAKPPQGKTTPESILDGLGWLCIDIGGLVILIAISSFATDIQLLVLLAGVILIAQGWTMIVFARRGPILRAELRDLR